jgi:hypothetical protein
MVCIVTSDDEQQVDETARMLVEHAMWRLFEPELFAKFSKPHTLGNRAFAYRNYVNEVHILRKLSESSLMELAESLERSTKDRTAQQRFVRIVGGPVVTYGIEPYQPEDGASDGLVKCQLTGKRIPVEDALVVHLMTSIESPTQKKRHSSMYRQALQVLNEDGPADFIEFVNANIQDLFHWFTSLVFSRRRLRFVDALLKVRCPELEIDAFVVGLVEAHGGDIEALSSCDLQTSTLVNSLRDAFAIVQKACR